MHYLSLQSSNHCASVSLHSEKKLLKYSSTNKIQKKQSESLMLLLGNLFFDNDIKYIDKVYLSRGPGSYTSMRAQLSIAKAISLAFKAKIETITTFQALAQKSYNNTKYVLTIFKENRPEYYFQIFRKVKNQFSEFYKISFGGAKEIEDILQKNIYIFNEDGLDIVCDFKYNFLDVGLFNMFNKVVRFINAKDIFNAAFIRGMSDNKIDPIYLFSHYAKK
tara:strand:- start:24 stop:683 length:660 start_codon:yes stop_codon:yes gene_type:complete